MSLPAAGDGDSEEVLKVRSKLQRKQQLFHICFYSQMVIKGAKSCHGLFSFPILFQESFHWLQTQGHWILDETKLCSLLQHFFFLWFHQRITHKLCSVSSPLLIIEFSRLSVFVLSHISVTQRITSSHQSFPTVQAETDKLAKQLNFKRTIAQFFFHFLAFHRSGCQVRIDKTLRRKG